VLVGASSTQNRRIKAPCSFKQDPSFHRKAPLSFLCTHSFPSQCVPVMLVLALLAAGQPDVGQQNCEACGLLVHHLEVIVHKYSWRPPEPRRTERLTRADVPAELIDQMEQFLGKACNAGGPVSRIRLCSANGDDTSRIRNPLGVRFENDGCRARLEERCAAVAPKLGDAMISAALNNVTAVACVDMLDGTGCTAERATLLLGPYYGTDPTHTFSLTLNAGVKDVWREHPGDPVYWHNAARHETLQVPPPGWDPNGPKEQVLTGRNLKNSKDEL
jgi:hypothetical protein